MKRILIVDDSMFTRNIHKSMLKTLGYETIEAALGMEGFETYKKEKPDGVIIDLLMPDMDGIEVVKLIRAFDAEAKVIICSTDRQKFRKEEGKEIGVEFFLHKPLEKDKLVEALATLL